MLKNCIEIAKDRENDKELIKKADISFETTNKDYMTANYCIVEEGDRINKIYTKMDETKC